MPKEKLKNINDYRAALPLDQRAALQKLRQTVHAAAPQAEETSSYDLVAFRQDGSLVALGAAGQHDALYPMMHTGGQRGV